MSVPPDFRPGPSGPPLPLLWVYTRSSFATEEKHEVVYADGVDHPLDLGVTLVDLQIPDHHLIGDPAFAGCTKVESVEFHENGTHEASHRSARITHGRRWIVPPLAGVTLMGLDGEASISEAPC